MKLRSLALTVFAVCTTLLSTTWLLADDDDEHEHRHGRKRTHALTAAHDPTWAEECSGCHMLYQPGLLPARSWRAMMEGLEDHFGDDATLEPAARDAITAFLEGNAADRVSNRRSAKIARAIPASATPLRFTETRYFQRKHHEIKAAVWQREKVASKANCVACHGRDAEKGVFDEHTVSIPK